MLCDRLRARARRLKVEIGALFIASRHPATPWYAKLVVAAVVAYALSPIDLIPDFIPVIGYLDDLIILPAAIALAIKLIPPGVMVECREKASAGSKNHRSRAAGAIIVGIWLVIAVLVAIRVLHAVSA